MSNTDLQQSLEELEQQRKSIFRSKIISYCIGITGLVIAIIGVFTLQGPIACLICAGIGFLIGQYINYQSNDKHDEYVASFKQKIIRTSLLNIDSNLIINLTRGLSISEFNNSGF